MTRMISLIIACLTIAISGCASVDAAKSDLGSGAMKVFHNPYDEVWNAALKALPALGISVASTDKTIGTIIGEKGVSAFSWGSVSRYISPAMSPLKLALKWFPSELSPSM